MAALVQIQTLRGNAGLQEALKVVQEAVDKRNAMAEHKNDQHVVDSFEAVKPNVKGMQVQLSLLAVLARNRGCNLIRLNVHNGNVALCGTPEDVQAVKDEWVPTYSRMATICAATYAPVEHGARMGFTNGFLCGMTAGMETTSAELAYGVGFLFAFPKPGTGVAYDLGASTLTDAPVVETAKTPKTPKTPKARQSKPETVEVAA